MKRKKKRMSPEERTAQDARTEARIRELRELEAKARAELEARRAAEG